MNDLFIRTACLDWDAVPQSSYLWTIDAIAGVDRIDFDSSVTCFVGENGSGKSTLLEAMAVSAGFNPEGGTKNYSFSTFDSHSQLCGSMRLVKGVKKPRWGYFLRAESFYNVATSIDRMDREGGCGAPVINSYGGVSLHRQSHGESFLTLVEKRFGGHGLYILDEPEAALSPSGIIRLIRHIDRLVKADSQLIISTHSPMLLAFPGAEIYQITAGGITAVPYTQTDHYRTTVRFLQNPESAMEDILGIPAAEE